MSKSVELASSALRTAKRLRGDTVAVVAPLVVVMETSVALASGRPTFPENAVIPPSRMVRVMESGVVVVVGVGVGTSDGVGVGVVVGLGSVDVASSALAKRGAETAIAKKVNNTRNKIRDDFICV